MHYESMGSIFGASDNAKVAQYIVDTFGTSQGTVDQWKQKIDSMWKVYESLVIDEKQPIFRLQTQPQIMYLVASRSGNNDISALWYLSALEEMTAKGLLDSKYWSPLEAKIYAQEHPTGIIDKALAAFKGNADTVKEATGTFKTLVFVAGLFAVGYILSQSAKVKREFL